MGKPLQDYGIADKGVELTQTPLHTPDGGLLAAQNVEYVREAGLGGLGSRRGLARYNTSALNGTVLALENLPFSYPGEQDLMVCLNASLTNGSNSWKKSVDGSSWTNLTLTQLQRAVEPVLIQPASTPLAGFFRGMRSAKFRRNAYYAGDNYITGANGTAPPLVVWNGTASYEALRIPPNPYSPVDRQANAIIDIWVANGLIYLAVWDPDVVTPTYDYLGRVLVFDPTEGTLYQVGNGFGGFAGMVAGGFPYCLTSYGGYLWAGCNGIDGNETGKIHRIVAGIDETWTLDHSSALHNGYYMTICPYKGKLYAGTSADSGGTARIEERDVDGTWSDSLVAPQNNISYFGGMIEFDDELYCAWYHPTGTKSYIYKFDGTSWSISLDVGVTYAVRDPGAPRIFKGNLYWPFSTNSDANDTDFVLKKTSGGGWSKALDAVGIRQCLGHYQP